MDQMVTSAAPRLAANQANCNCTIYLTSKETDNVECKHYGHPDCPADCNIVNAVTSFDILAPPWPEHVCCGTHAVSCAGRLKSWMTLTSAQVDTSRSCSACLMDLQKIVSSMARRRSGKGRLIKSFPFSERSVAARSKRCQMKRPRPYQKWSKMALAQHRNAGLLPYRSCCHPARWVNDLQPMPPRPNLLTTKPRRLLSSLAAPQLPSMATLINLRKRE
jgi:hypothetical protein